MALLVGRGFAARLSICRFALAHYSHRTLAKETDRWQFSKTYSPFCVMKDFKIRLIETVEEFEGVIIDAMVKEGWRPGLKDAECFLACDPTGAYVGELNGKPICCVTLTKYGDRFAFGGSYIVNKEYRGKGYGRHIENATVMHAKQFRSVGIVSAMPRSEELNKRKGFRSHFYGATFVFHLPAALTCFSEASERSPVKIKCIEEVNREELFMYDTKVFGFERNAFLSKWLSVAGSFVNVAINTEGSILGYVVARPTFVKEGFKIGPLFADSEPIAEKLLQAVFKELLWQEELSPIVSIDAPTKKATELCERLQGKRVFELVYMVINDLPDACFDKWFGYTSTQLG